MRNFLTSCKAVRFSRRTLHHGVSKYVTSNTFELGYDVIERSFRTHCVDVTRSRTVLQLCSATVVLTAVSVALETALLYQVVFILNGICVKSSCSSVIRNSAWFGQFWFMNWIVSIPLCTRNKFIKLNRLYTTTNNGCRSTTG